ncbi:hypothetical protein HU200_047240 [Digitaria exilis]|uniref:Pentatricopeptide repeat-containing protein n=1 Tax=Digitaria exilis TaxID=1010633 RepID=A0A835EA54_9POAL|nr:hypothetical protein HU200_047240 [Digitaria exilis]
MEFIISRLAAASSSDSRPREQLLGRLPRHLRLRPRPPPRRSAPRLRAPGLSRPPQRAGAQRPPPRSSCRAQLGYLLVVCGEARIAPDACTSGHRADSLSFGTVVAALCDVGKLEEAFEVKDMMVRRYNVSPNAYVFASLIKGLCGKGMWMPL